MAKKKKYNLFTFDQSYVNSGKIIAGIDLSLNHTGIVVLDDKGQILYQEAIILKTRQKDNKKYHFMQFKVNNTVSEPEELVSDENHEIDQLKRIIVIRNRVKRIIGLFDIKHIAIEGYNMGRTGNQGAVYQIGELAGLIKVLLRENNKDFQLVSPSSLKKFITGSGTAQKEGMQAWVYKKYFLVFEDDNEADAFALAKIYLELGGELKKYCKQGASKIYQIQLEEKLDEKK